MTSGPIADGMRRRRSQPSVTGDAPTKRELLPLIEAAASVADHGSLRPWRVIALRGEARKRLGFAIAEAAGLEGGAAEKMAQKPLRAPLLLAIVVSPKKSHKVPEWEQESVASGVAHALSLVLDEAGWGVIWRTGLYTRSKAVHRMHKLEPDEKLLGWLYIGGKAKTKSGRRKPVKAKDFLSSL
ncbi:nitroreductase [Pseudolysinimonas sp.]|uniref:nitroreductase n=1 Tax=Pseudolysinimonas sp. TaxID=2680009 RepID=UPI0037852F8A